MPIKQLPAIGDSNWGDTLNNYITQTTNNTNGGGFNSFTNFADRPTNLTADDKGKTYLNKLTGNFHIWDGSAWNVQHTAGIVNVRDIGKAGYGDGTDDTTVVQTAINLCQGQNGFVSPSSKLFLPAGGYRFEVECQGSQTITIYGDSVGGAGGGASTQVYAVNPDGYAFTFHCTSQQSLESMDILGLDNTGTIAVSNGVKCIPVPNVPQNSGYLPVNMKNVKMRGCKIALYKQATLFGKFENCFFGGEIGVFNKGGGALFATIYSGFDQYNHCYWVGCKKACVYFDNANNYDENQTKFENCWFEGNPGIVCLAIGTGIGLSSLKFSHCWFEANSSNRGQNVTIDGQTYTIQGFVFKFSRGIIEHGGLPFGISLTDRSYLKLDYVSGGNEGGINLDGIECDATSHLDLGEVGDSATGGYGTGTSYLAESALMCFPSGGGSFNAGLNLYRTKNSRPTITRKYKNIIPEGSCNRLVNLPGINTFFSAGVTQEIITGDGLYNNKCMKVVMPVNQSKITIGFDYYYNSQQNYNISQFIAISFSIRTDDNYADIDTGYYNMGAGGRVTLKDKDWHTHCGIVSYGGAAAGVEMRNRLTTSSTIFLSKIQVVPFATYQQAADYLKSDFYALPEGDPISWHDSAIPTTGNYAKGDVIYNTAPVIGGNLGWICIEAGNPGTWRPFGTIN